MATKAKKIGLSVVKSVTGTRTTKTVVDDAFVATTISNIEQAEKLLGTLKGCLKGGSEGKGISVLGAKSHKGTDQLNAIFDQMEKQGLVQFAKPA